MSSSTAHADAQLAELQNWYLAQCNGDWEHSFGIEISTLDNPGRSMTVDLRDTELQDRTFVARKHGEVASDVSQDEDWFVCKVEQQRFVASCGPRKLGEVISVFLAWAKSNG